MREDLSQPMFWTEQGYWHLLTLEVFLVQYVLLPGCSSWDLGGTSWKA